MLADAATGCSAAFGGCAFSCPREEAGLVCTADSGVSAVAGDEDGFADCWAFAVNVSSNEFVSTQPQIRIAQPRFRLDVRRTLRKSAAQWRSYSRFTPPASFSEVHLRWVLAWLNTADKNKFRRIRKSHNHQRFSGL